MKILKSPLLIGGYISVIIVFVSLIKQDLSFCMKVSGWIGAGLLILAAISSGTLLNGDSIRANLSRETKVDREERIKYASILFKFSIPNIVLFMICYFI